MRALLALAALALTPALAQTPHVAISEAPERVAVTVYADDLALVREERRIELPEGFAIVEFRGVSDAIVPQAAVVEGLDGIVERNFDYELLSPYALVREGIGERVTLVRTNPGSGAATRESATIVAGGDGVVLDFGDGRIEALECSGLPEGLVFESAPPGLRAKPTLSARVHNKRAGRQKLTLVYLVHGISWRADYNVALAPSGERFDVEAWITLTNDGGTSYEDADVAVVAGDLNRQDDGVPIVPHEVLSDHCWAWGRRWPGFWSAPVEAPPEPIGLGGVAAERSAGVEEIIVTAMKREEVAQTEAQREELLDYHFYRVPWRTTLAAKQSKQVRFLLRENAGVEWIYTFWNPAVDDGGGAEPEPAETLLRFRNGKRNRLGEPLPEGTLHVVQKLGADSFLLGESEIANTAIDLPVEATLGESALVMGTLRVTEYDEKSAIFRTLSGGEPFFRIRATLEREIANARPEPVIVEVRQDTADSLRISNSSHPYVRDRGVPMWRLAVPANSVVTLRYRISYVQ